MFPYLYWSIIFDIYQRLIDGVSIQYWACVTFASRLHPNDVRMFCNNLVGACNDMGMVKMQHLVLYPFHCFLCWFKCSHFVWQQINGRPCVDVGQARPDNLEAALRNTHRQSSQMLAQQGVTRQLDLLIVVLPDANASVFYGKQVKWFSQLVVFVGYFLYAFLFKL